MAGTTTTAPLGAGARASQFAKANSNLLFAFGVFAIFVIILVPMPTWLMDLLLILNITASLILLLNAIFVTRPLSLNSFPTILLVVTFYRLSLNIATTRLILSNGDQAAGATNLEGVAGHVVATFGSMVAGGNDTQGVDVVIGLIVFIILVIIQFVVVTKGATRIAEVAARFTLDSLPGKQLAIDADLNAGVIDDKEAKKRRETLSAEADFYGSMDGASKFVRGDAIAGILITIINIVGGLIVGMVSYGMTFSEAGEVYTKLSIGDGLVAQIPAFLISIGAGIIITRASASEKPLGADIAQQYASNPQVLLAVGLILSVMLILMGNMFGGGGLPWFQMLLVVGVAFMGFAALRKRAATDVVETRKREEAEKAKTAKEPEEVESLLFVDPLEVEIGYGLIKMVDATQGGDLLERVTMIRRQMAIDLGMVVPPIRIRDNMQLEPNEYIIKIKGTRAAKGVAMADHYLAMDSGVATGRIDGVPTTEPAFGLPALWITATEKQRAEAFGYTVVDASSVVATHLTEVVKNNAHDLLTREEVNSLVQNLKKNSPHLIEEVVGPVLKQGEIQKVLQNLLRERVSIRDLATIIETLGDYGSRTKDVEILTEYVRNAISRSICDGVKEADGKIYCITLEPRLEDHIAASIERTDGGSYLRLEPNSLNKIMNAVASEIEKLLSGGHTPAVLCSPQIRPQVRRICEGIQAGIHVLSFNEIDKGVDVESLGMVSKPGDL